MFKLFNGDCLQVLPALPYAKCIFADPPDNIGLKYKQYKDNVKDYEELLYVWLEAFLSRSEVVWFSFNAKWTFAFGHCIYTLLKQNRKLEAKPCVQVFTFGQHNHCDLGNNHRPLWRIMHKGTVLYPDQVRVPSWRQENGDKRADARGRVPGDVFDFTRVTGNSKQRRTWHPTQLNEGLIERCIQLSTTGNELVIDPFAGTGTTLRVCRHLKRPCESIEIDPDYCRNIATENYMTRKKGWWSCVR